MDHEGIDINIHRNLYLESNTVEYRVYTLKKNLKTPDKPLKEIIGHWSTIESLMKSFVDLYLKNYSKARTIKELTDDIEKAYSIIKKIKVDLTV